MPAQQDDLYAVLGVPATGSPDEIARAYRRLCRRLHPDAHPGDPTAADRFAQVAAAYRVLGDPRRRADYDRLRRLAGEESPALRGRPIPVTVIPTAGKNSLLAPGHVSTADPARWWAAPPTSRGPRRPVPRRGADVAADVTVELTDAARGATIPVEPPTSGLPTRRVRIPAGVVDGQRLRVPGGGQPGRDGGPSGDLYVTVRLRPPPGLTRHGTDLAVTVPITFSEAVTGTRLALRAAGDAPAEVELPVGTRSGDVLHVPGHGVPTVTGIGDLLVTVVIDVPIGLNAAARAAVEALARVLPCPRGDGGPAHGV